MLTAMYSINMILGASHANIASLIHHPNVIGALALSVSNAVSLSSQLCNDPFVRVLKNGLATIIEVLTALGVVVAIIGIIVGGLMRATSWGNDQRIAASNKAITSAIVGLIIVLLAVALGNAVPTWFGLQDKTCSLAPTSQSTSSTTSGSSSTSATTPST